MYNNNNNNNKVQSQKSIRTLGEDEHYKFLGILEADNIKQAEMKEKG